MLGTKNTLSHHGFQKFGPRNLPHYHFWTNLDFFSVHIAAYLTRPLRDWERIRSSWSRGGYLALEKLLFFGVTIYMLRAGKGHCWKKIFFLFCKMRFLWDVFWVLFEMLLAPAKTQYLKDRNKERRRPTKNKKSTPIDARDREMLCLHLE